MRKFNIGDTLSVKPKPWRLDCSDIVPGEVVTVVALASTTTTDYWVYLEGKRNYSSDGSYPESIFEIINPKDYDPSQQPFDEQDI